MSTGLEVTLFIVVERALVGVLLQQEGYQEKKKTDRQTARR